MNFVLIIALGAALVACALALTREMRLRKALEKLLRIILSRWSAHVSKTNVSNFDVDSRADRAGAVLERDLTVSGTPFTLAKYSSRQVKRGRTAAGRLNGEEPLSRYAQVGNGIERDPGCWVDELLDNTRWSVADQVAVRIDAQHWFRTLSHRVRQIARDLAHGFSTSEVAKKHGVTPGRISQIRRELCEGWRAFQGEVAPAAV